MRKLMALVVLLCGAASVQAAEPTDPFPAIWILSPPNQIYFGGPDGSDYCIAYCWEHPEPEEEGLETYCSKDGAVLMTYGEGEYWLNPDVTAVEWKKIPDVTAVKWSSGALHYKGVIYLSCP